MSQTVDVVMSHPHDGHEVGDRVGLPNDEAKNLVRTGYAQYATKSGAEAAGDDPAKTTAGTKAARSKSKPGT